MSNIKRENACPGSGVLADGTALALGATRTYCPRCHRTDVRIRVCGFLYVHARPR